MISVDEALAKVLALGTPLGTETVPLARAHGRVLAQPVEARRDQPPFAASAMDGYALIGLEAEPDAMFKVIGEAQAGAGFTGKVGAGQAVRIFTGAPVPEGATRVILQEDVTRRGDLITLGRDIGTNDNIRPQGNDFRIGDRVEAPRRLAARDLALIAAMNAPEVEVFKRPEVALMATGDELVMPGEAPGPDQIIASNSFGLKAMFEAAGATVRMLPIARDTHENLEFVFGLAKGADLVVTIGGASVGDHDLVGQVAASLGLEQSFYKVAMRPGKPLMAGRMGDAAMIGLPGNPISSMVCGAVFILPLLNAMQGLTDAGAPLTARLAEDIPANGPRQHYMRAELMGDEVHVMSRQDSALLSVFARANAMVIRPPHDGPRAAGELVEVLPL